MFSKRSLTITLAFVLLMGLAVMGIAYGAWTQTLNINGTAHTGTFNVTMDYLYYDYDVVGCSAVIAPDGHTLTVTIANAYPGYHCGGAVSIRNLSSIPAKINGLQQVTNTVPAEFQVGYPLVYMTDAVGNTVPATGSFKLDPAKTGGGVVWNFNVPAGETGHQGESYTFSYTFIAEQGQ